MKHLENIQEFEQLLENKELLVVDFYADWCGPCRMLSPTVEALANKYEGKANIVKLNVDNVEEVAYRYRVQSIPTLIFFKNKEEVARVIGYKSQEDLEEVIEKLL